MHHDCVTLLAILKSRLQPRFGIRALREALDQRCSIGQLLVAIFIMTPRTTMADEDFLAPLTACSIR